MMGIGMAVRPPRSRGPVLMMIDALRRIGGTLIYAPDNALGDGAPNLLTAPEDISLWKDSTASKTIALNSATSSDGTQTTDTFTATGVSGTWCGIGDYAVVAAGSNVGKTFTYSVELSCPSGTATVQLQISDRSYYTANASVTVTTTPTRFSFSSSGSAGGWSSSGVAIGGGITTPIGVPITVWGAKLEQGTVATAYTPQSVLRQRGVYVDNAGTTPVTAVADLIGLITDKSYSGQLGVELLSGVWNNSYANTFDTFTSTSFGGFTGSTAGAKTNIRVFVPFTGSVSDFYEIRFNISMSGATCKLLMYSTAHSGVQFIRGSAGVDPGVVSGEVVVRCVLTASGANGIMLGFDTSAGGTVTVTSASSRKVPGNHATQSAVASKPSVQRVPKRLGPNLVSNGGFDNGTTGWAQANVGVLSVSGGELVVTNGSTAGSRGYQMIATEIGKTYVETCYARPGTSPAMLAWATTGGSTGGGSVTATSAQTLSLQFTATTTSTSITLHTTSTTLGHAASFDNVEVREVLEWANVISFDGSNDFLQTGITTGNEGWVCAGVTFGGALGSKETVFSSGAGAANLKGIWLTRLEGVSNQLRMGVGNGTELTMPTHVGIDLLNAKRVVEGGWDATTVFAGVDGATTSLTRSGSASPSPSMLEIGRYVSGSHYFSGPMFATAYTPVLPSAADRATIRNGIAALQGRVL